MCFSFYLLSYEEEELTPLNPAPTLSITEEILEFINQSRAREGLTSIHTEATVRTHHIHEYIGTRCKYNLDSNHTMLSLVDGIYGINGLGFGAKETGHENVNYYSRGKCETICPAATGWSKQWFETHQ